MLSFVFAWTDIEGVELEDLRVAFEPQSASEIGLNPCLVGSEIIHFDSGHGGVAFMLQVRPIRGRGVVVEERQYAVQILGVI